MIYLYGASGHAKVIVDVLNSTSQQIAGVFDDNKSFKNFMGLDFLGVFNKTKIKSDSKFIICIGDNEIRKTIVKKINTNFSIAIDKSSIVSPSVTINNGTVIMPNTVINSSTIIGKHCIINTSSVIEHDCVLANYVHVSPNATLTGKVKVGEGTHIGAGAIILPGITIGNWCKIGAGTIVLKDIPDNSVVVGNPGKIIRQN